MEHNMTNATTIQILDTDAADKIRNAVKVISFQTGSEAAHAAYAAEGLTCCSVEIGHYDRCSFRGTAVAFDALMVTLEALRLQRKGSDKADNPIS